MKPLLYIFVAACLLVGCTKPDAKLEARVKKLEQSVVDLVELEKKSGLEQIEFLNKMHTNELASSADFKAFRKANEDYLKVILAQVENHGHILDDHATAIEALKQQRPTSTAAAARVSIATKSGVPVAVYNQIAAEAARRYPTDYDMQVFVIKQQIEAYLKLHPSP